MEAEGGEWTGTCASQRSSSCSALVSARCMDSTSVMRLPTMSASPLFCSVRRKSHTGLNVACGVLNSRDDRCLRVRNEMACQHYLLPP